MEIVRKTIENDLEFLRQVSKPVDFHDKTYLEDIKKLEQYCLSNECFAMAPVQIGIPKRRIYLKNTKLDISITNIEYNEGKVLINPIIESRKGMTKFWEGCESCLDWLGLVSRPYEIEIKYFDIDGIEHKEIIRGFEATVISHEYDHLNGVLHMDIAEKLIRLPKSDRKEFRKDHTYEILSKTGTYPIPKVNKKVLF